MFVCEECKFNTTCKSRWDIHINTELHKTGKRKKRSDIKEPYKCINCDYTSKNKTIFNTHILNKHKTKYERETEFTFYCKLCDFGTFNNITLENHNNTEKHKHNETIKFA